MPLRGSIVELNKNDYCSKRTVTTLKCMLKELPDIVTRTRAMGVNQMVSQNVRTLESLKKVTDDV